MAKKKSVSTEQHGKIHAAVYVSGGRPLVVFNKRTPNGAFYKGRRADGTEVLLGVRDLVTLHNMHLLEQQKEGKAGHSARYARVLEQLCGRDTVLDFGFVPNALGTRRNSMIKQESELLAAAKAGVLPVFSRDRTAVVSRDGKEYYEFPALCMTNSGVPFDGMAQLSALLQCRSAGVQRQAGNVYMLSQGRAGKGVPQIELATYSPPSKEKSERVNTYLLYPTGLFQTTDSNIEGKVQRIRFERSSAISESKSGKILYSVNATDPSMGLYNYVAGYLAASRMGVPFRTTEAVREKMRKEFVRVAGEYMLEGRYGEFLQSFNDGVKRRCSALCKEIPSKVREAMLPKPEMKRDITRSVSVERSR